MWIWAQRVHWKIFFIFLFLYILYYIASYDNYKLPNSRRSEYIITMKISHETASFRVVFCGSRHLLVNLDFTKKIIINNHDKHLLKKINNITLQQFVNDEHYGTLLLIIIIFLLFYLTPTDSHDSSRLWRRHLKLFTLQYSRLLP